MLKIFYSVLVFVFGTSIVLALGSGDRLDLTITPIRVDILAATGATTSGSVTLYNNSDQPYSFRMSAEDCTATADYRAPLCSAISSGSLSIASLASWITFDTNMLFSIAPKSKRTIGYYINTPSNAVPGGHYGAVFFNSPESTNGSTISMNRRIGSLLLVTVPGNIIVAPEFGSMLIDTHGGAGPGVSNVGRNFWTFSQSGTLVEELREKGNRLMMIFTDPVEYQPIIDAINPFWSIPRLESAPIIKDIETKNRDTPPTEPILSLGLPVENRGTIHIIPEGKITLFTEDGTQLNRIGKELIKNENGAIVGEKIVDYITINEENGNILPNTNRTFMMNWYGFARENIGADGKITITYETPDVYYSRIAREESEYIYPWEKLAVKHMTRILMAHVDLSYTDPITSTIISRNYDIPVTIESNEIVKTYNTGLLTPIILVVLIYGWFSIWRRRRYHYNSRDILIAEDGDDEIAVLERARAAIFAHGTEGSTMVTKKKPVTKKPVSKVTSGEAPSHKGEAPSHKKNTVKENTTDKTPNPVSKRVAKTMEPKTAKKI